MAGGPSQRGREAREPLEQGKQFMETAEAISIPNRDTKFKQFREGGENTK